MRQVSFSRMEDGTREDYELLDRLERELHTDYADRLLEWVQWNEGETGYRISRFEHVLQSATRAYRDGRDEEFVVCCLLHDIGDLISPYNHSQAAADILRPYVLPSLRRGPQRPRCLQRSPLVPRHGRILREVRPELLRSRLRVATAGLLRTHGEAGVQPPQARYVVNGEW